MKLTGKTAIVTGGAGFIGSHLCDALVSKKLRVYCLDNLLTGLESNLNGVKNNPLFTFIKWDVVSGLPVLPQVDYIFHLASPASVPDYQKYDEETAMANSVGTRNLLMMAKAYQAKFLFASTSEVYGDPLVHPQTEAYWGNVNPVGIRSCYDEAKRFGEMLTMVYGRKGVDARIVRIFNTYGPRLRPDDGRVISNLIVQALGNIPMTIYGDGLQTRSYCYVSDMVDGILRAMFFDSTNGEVFNLGNPEEFSVIKTAQMIRNATGTSSEIVYKPLPQDDPIRRKPDISKAKRVLGWNPVVPFAEGLVQSVRYYKSL